MKHNMCWWWLKHITNGSTKPTRKKTWVKRQLLCFFGKKIEWITVLIPLEVEMWMNESTHCTMNEDEENLIKIYSDLMRIRVTLHFKTDPLFSIQSQTIWIYLEFTHYVISLSDNKWHAFDVSISHKTSLTFKFMRLRKHMKNI